MARKGRMRLAANYQRSDEPTVNRSMSHCIPVLSSRLAGGFKSELGIIAAGCRRNRRHCRSVEVEIGGDRKICSSFSRDPQALETYGLTTWTVQLVSTKQTSGSRAGSDVDTASGRMSIKVLGLIREPR